MTDDELTPPAAAEAKKAPARKAPVKKVPAKKVAAKKVPAKKVPAKKVAAEKVQASKVPAKAVATTPITAEDSVDDGKNDVTTEQLAAEIERTREDLAHTLDAIAEKVSPKRVASRTTKKVTQAVKGTAQDAVESVKEGASAVKDKVSGESESGADGAAPRPALTSISSPPAPVASGHGLPPTYLIGGGVAALALLLILRRRRRG